MKSGGPATPGERAPRCSKVAAPVIPESEAAHLLLERMADGVALLKLSRPASLNALTDGMVDDLGRMLDELTTDASVRGLVLIGVGRGFCAGFDLGLADKPHARTTTARPLPGPRARRASAA